MAFLPTEKILETVQRILRDRMALRQAELRGLGPDTCPLVKDWRIGDWDLPDAGKGAYPLGVVDLDDPALTSERREQDTGETLEVNLVARIVFEHESFERGRAQIEAARYGDLLRYTVNREAKGVNPKDLTVLPGWFRMWAHTMRIGDPDTLGLKAAEVKIRLTVDVQQAFSVT
jgi:hypothetical protein